MSKRKTSIRIPEADLDEDSLSYDRDLESEAEEEGPSYREGFWHRKEKEVSTVTIDYSLTHLSSLIAKEIINLEPKFQRRLRWNEKRKSKLIESLMMGIPIPPIFLNEDSNDTYSVIDGRQRLLAIYEFMTNRLTLTGLEVFGDFNGLKLRSIPSAYSGKLENRYTLRAIVVVRETDTRVMHEVFTRVNTGGVQLNAQEIRNAVYDGPLNDMIMEVSECPDFHNLLGIHEREKSTIWNKMRDAEFVLRFLTFRDNWQSFPGPLKANMDDYMDLHRAEKPEGLKKLRSQFLDAVSIVKAAFGEYAFRRWDPKGGKWFGPVNAALYDAQMFSCFGLKAAALRERRDKIIEEMKKLFENSRFGEYISRGTNTPEFFRGRITMVGNMLERVTREGS